jgi:DHA1 family multidrug resistance protein-like MFS transporter
VVLKEWVIRRFGKWIEPELFHPFVFGILISLTLSEFVRGALTLTLLPTYGRTVLGFAVEWTGLALSIHYLADNLLRAPAGWLADRVGQRFVLLIGFAIAVPAVFWMMHVTSVWQLLLCTGLYGIAVTPMWPAAISGIGAATPQVKRGAFMGYVYVFWMVGTGLGPVLINLVIGRTYTWAFWILIVVDALGFLLAWMLVHTSKAGQVRGALEHKDLHRHHKDYWKSLWQNVRQVAFLFPGMFAQTFAVASLIPILSLYAKVVLHVSGAMYSTILVLGGICTIILLIPAGKLVDKYGPRHFLVSAFLGAGVILALYPFYHTMWTTFLAVGLLGISYAFILPSWNSVLDHSIDPDKKGILWGVFMTVEGLGSAVGPYIGGLMWDTVSPEAPFWLSAGVILVMGLLYIVLPIEHAERHGSRETRFSAVESAGILRRKPKSKS